MDSGDIKKIIEKLCKGKFPLQFFINFEKKAVFYHSIFLYTYPQDRLFAIDFIQPPIGNNYIFPNVTPQIVFGKYKERYKFDCRIIRKMEKEKTILLTLPSNIEKISERRKHPRTYFNMQNFIRLWFNFPKGHPQWRKKPWEVKSVNICQGGLAFTADFLKLDNIFEIGDKIEIFLDETNHNNSYAAEAVHVGVNNICGCKFISKDILSQKPNLFKNEEQTKAERRKSFRFKIPDTEPIELEMTIPDDIILHGKIIDISTGGMGISLTDADDQTRNKLTSDLTVYLKFTLPDLGEVASTFTVRHCKESFVGLEFKELPQDQQSIIVQFIRKNWARYNTIEKNSEQKK